MSVASCLAAACSTRLVEPLAASPAWLGLRPPSYFDSCKHPRLVLLVGKQRRRPPPVLALPRGAVPLCRFRLGGLQHRTACGTRSRCCLPAPSPPSTLHVSPSDAEAHWSHTKRMEVILGHTYGHTGRLKS